MEKYIIGAALFVAGITLWIVGGLHEVAALSGAGLAVSILGVCIAFSRRSKQQVQK